MTWIYRVLFAEQQESLKEAVFQSSSRWTCWKSFCIVLVVRYGLKIQCDCQKLKSFGFILDFFFLFVVPVEDPIREIAEYMDPSRDEIWEKGPSNKQVTFLVYREGDQLNFFRVVDRGDGTLTPLSESLR